MFVRIRRRPVVEDEISDWPVVWEGLLPCEINAEEEGLPHVYSLATEALAPGTMDWPEFWAALRDSGGGVNGAGGGGGNVEGMDVGAHGGALNGSLNDMRITFMLSRASDNTVATFGLMQGTKSERERE